MPALYLLRQAQPVRLADTLALMDAADTLILIEDAVLLGNHPLLSDTPLNWYARQADTHSRAIPLASSRIIDDSQWIEVIATHQPLITA